MGFGFTILESGSIGIGWMLHRIAAGEEGLGGGGLQRSCLHLFRFSFYLSFPLFLGSTGQDGRSGWLFLLLPIPAAFFLALNGDDCLLCLLCFSFSCWDRGHNASHLRICVCCLLGLVGAWLYFCFELTCFLELGGILGINEIVVCCTIHVVVFMGGI